MQKHILNVSAVLAVAGVLCLATVPVEAAVCGDSVPDIGEQCDDGNVANGDGCNSICQVEFGSDCTDAVAGDELSVPPVPPEPSQCLVGVCGDSVQSSNEACDDGNAGPGDGCDSTCQVEDGFACTSATNWLDVVSGDDARPGFCQVGGGGIISIDPTSYSVQETDGTVEITVTRTDDIDTFASVDYYTADGEATVGDDYEGATGTLEWSEGDTSASKTISVTIVDDADREGPETFTLGLTGVLGNGVAIGNSTGTVSVDDPEDIVDTDEDGVTDDLDSCPGTVIPEGAPTSRRGLGRNRWTLDNSDGTFMQGPPQSGRTLSFSTVETRGCSCEQIVAEQGLGRGHSKYGCSNSAMMDWINKQ